MPLLSVNNTPVHQYKRASCLSYPIHAGPWQEYTHAIRSRLQETDPHAAPEPADPILRG